MNVSMRILGKRERGVRRSIWWMSFAMGCQGESLACSRYAIAHDDSGAPSTPSDYQMCSRAAFDLVVSFYRLLLQP